MNRVVHFEVQADDIERAKKFYQNVLGWKVEQIMKKEDSEDSMDYWGITTGEGHGINGGLYERPKEEKDKSNYYDCTVDVADIDQSIQAVKDNGGKIMSEKMEIPEVGWFARAEDTEGNHFGLMQSTGWKGK